MENNYVNMLKPGDVLIGTKDLVSHITGNTWTKKGNHYTVLPTFYRGQPCITTEQGGFISLRGYLEYFDLVDGPDDLHKRYERAMHGV